MNCCLTGNNCLWLLIILLILGTCGTNVLTSRAFTGCGWPILAACAYCLCKNGTLAQLANCLRGIGGCGCDHD